jgi:hypothetical protein
MNATEIERLGHELSNGWGLWGTIDHIDGSEGWTPEKRAALINGWIAGVRTEGFTDYDAAAIGDYKAGRWFVDGATFYIAESQETVRKRAEEEARKLVLDLVKYEAGGSVKQMKAQLVANYTDYYPNARYAARLGHDVRSE